MRRILTTLAAISTVLLNSCITTVGSRDFARIPAFAAPTIAQEMTSDLVSYPDSSVPTPAGAPIYDAFGNQFAAMGWSVISYENLEWKDENYQRNYIRIFTQHLGGGETLVQMNTPYFDVNRIYKIDERRRSVSPITNKTLNLKKR